MRNKILEFTVLIIVLTTFSSFRRTSELKKKEDFSILWTREYNLNWDDFQGRPVKSSDYAAIADVGVKSTFNVKEEILYVRIEAFFNKKSSWVKKSHRTALLLEHEQGHFDIAEIYARRMRKAIIESKFSRRNGSRKIERITAQELNELSVYQLLYDKETNHHINEERQVDWNERIKKQLIELEDYSSPELFIKIKN